MAVQSLLRVTQDNLRLQGSPFYQPSARREGQLARRGGHRPTNERALISSERAIQQQHQARRREIQEERQQITKAEEARDQANTSFEPQLWQEGNNTMETTAEAAPGSIPETPPKSLPHSLAIRTPERPRPRRTPSPEASPRPIYTLNEPPASTAPPVLGALRPKRRRQHTARFTEARERGYIGGS